jgi:sugar O-acyltransferase (sialic acid O-acetyltransferase NeuD family)
MKKKLVIIGIDLFGELSYEYFSKSAEYEVIGFAPTVRSIKKEFLDLPVVSLDDIRETYPPQEYYTFVALAHSRLNRKRTALFQQLKFWGYKCATYISPQALVWPNVSIGENCIILDMVYLQPFSRVGDNVFLLGANYLGHGAKIGNHVYVAPHAVILGGAEIGENSFIGANSTIRDSVKIAKDNYIGMGCLININTKENEVYKQPAAILSKTPAKKFHGVKE